MKVRKRFIFILVALIILGGVGLMLFCTKVQKKNLQEYVENELGVAFGNGITAEDGRIEKSFFEESAYIRLSIGDEKVKEIEELLSTKYTPYDELDSYTLPGYQGNVYRGELAASKIQDLYFVMKKGKGSKTRSIEVYVAQNEKGNTYLYFMG